MDLRPAADARTLRRRRRHLVAGSLVVAALLLAACGAKDGDDDEAVAAPKAPKLDADVTTTVAPTTTTTAPPSTTSTTRPATAAPGDACAAATALLLQPAGSIAVVDLPEGERRTLLAAAGRGATGTAALEVSDALALLDVLVGDPAPSTSRQVADLTARLDLLIPWAAERCRPPAPVWACTTRVVTPAPVEPTPPPTTTPPPPPPPPPPPAPTTPGQLGTVPTTVPPPTTTTIAPGPATPEDAAATSGRSGLRTELGRSGDAVTFGWVDGGGRVVNRLQVVRGDNGWMLGEAVDCAFAVVQNEETGGVDPAGS